MECPPSGPEMSESDIDCRFGKTLFKIGKSLTQEEVRKFASFFHDTDRIAYLQSLDKIKDSINVPLDHGLKSAEESAKLRAEGNKLFSRKKFRESLAKFNSSIRCAPFYLDANEKNADGTPKYIASEELLLAMGNRSAALHFHKKYELSIRDIDLALDWGYAAEQRYKLWDRRAKCLLQLGRKDEAMQSYRKGITSLSEAKLDKEGLSLWLSNFDKQIKKAKSVGENQYAEKRKAVALDKEVMPSMDTKRSEQIEYATENIGMTYSKDLGREIVALNDIDVGEILFIEKGTATVVYISSSENMCNHCLVVTEAPLPCHTCSNVGFCSTACRKKAWDTFHQVECKYMNWFSEFWITKIGHLALMMTVVAGYKTLREYFGTNLAHNINRESTDLGMTDGVYKSNYHAIFHMVTNNQLRLPDGLISFGIMTSIMLHVLKQCSSFWESTKEFGDTHEEVERIVATSIMHHMQIVQCNAFTTTTVHMSPDFRECKTVDTGLSIFPTLALMNHSCDPNVDCYNYGNTMTVRAARDIRRGEAIYGSYGMNYYTHEKKVRKMYYMTQFYFSCECFACANDWPLWGDIECATPTFKCDQCDTELPCKGPVVMDCPKCKRIMDIGEVLYRLEKSHECFALAMDDVMKWRLDTALPILEEHLRLMQMYIKSPWREIVTCQATIQQIYNIFSHRYQNPLE